MLNLTHAAHCEGFVYLILFVAYQNAVSYSILEKKIVIISIYQGKEFKIYIDPR